MSRFTRALSITAAAGLLVTLSACAGGSGEVAEGTSDDPIQFGVADAGEAYWETYVAAAAEEGIEVELVSFSDYAQPNPALTAGEIDINQFQHIIYLADYNESAGEDLQPIGSTAIYPLGLYSQQYESVEDIPDGAEVAIPNDETNQARALLVLQSAGLIALEDGGSVFSTPDQIIADESRVEVTPLDASVTANSLQDVAAAVINNDFIANAGFTGEDAIAQDDPSDPAAFPYVNIFAVRADDADNEVFQKLVEIYQTNEDVQQGVLDASAGTAELVQISAEELQQSLADVQDDIRSQG